MHPSLSLLGGRKPFRRRRRYSRSDAPVFDSYTSFTLSESSKDTIGDPRESWVEKGRLPSFSEFLGELFQRANPTNSPGRCRPCCPIDREEDSSAHNKNHCLIVSMHTDVEKYGLVFSSSARGNLQPRPIIPRKEATFDAPTFFDTVLDDERISKSSGLVVPDVDSGAVLAFFFLGKVPTCLPPRAHHRAPPRPPNVVHPSNTSDENIMLKKGGVSAPC